MRTRGVLCLVISLLVGAAAAQDRQDARVRAARRLRQALENEQNLSAETRAALREFVDAPQGVDKGEVARIVDEYLEARPLQSSERLPDVLDRLRLYGDLRLRYEHEFQRDGRPDRQRARLRFRLGADLQASDELTLGARIVTGSADDPNSPHVTFGDVFDNFEISLDRASLTYRPTWAPGALLTVGKFNHPFRRNPVYGELVWDADVHPNGALAGYAFTELAPLDRLELKAGIYPVLEQNGADDAFLSVYEAASHVRLSEEVSSDQSIAFYHYTDTTPDGSTAVLGDNAGNRTVDRDADGNPDAFASHFGVLDANVSVTFTQWQHPVTLGAEYIVNLRADRDDQGWAVGAAVGSTQSAGDWRAYYQFQIVEQEAVFSAFAQDDFPLATNFAGHAFGANFQISDAAGLHVWGLVAARDRVGTMPTDDSDEDQWRLRLDLNVKF